MNTIINITKISEYLLEYRFCMLGLSLEMTFPSLVFCFVFLIIYIKFSVRYPMLFAANNVMKLHPTNLSLQ